MRESTGLKRFVGLMAGCVLGLSPALAQAEEEAAPEAAVVDAQGFTPIFDGESLVGWRGDPALNSGVL